MQDTATLSLPTAADLMTREVTTLDAGMPLWDAARVLARAGVHGAPVADGDGRLVGVLSVSDLARWVGRQPTSSRPLTCAFQEMTREPGGRETVHCLLHEDSCPLQRVMEGMDGRFALVCAEPHCVPTDWQVVATEALPPGDVRHHMTTDVVMVPTTAPLAEIARVMLNQGVRRLVVVDDAGRPAGIVSVTDVLKVLAGGATASDREGR